MHQTSTRLLGDLANLLHRNYSSGQFDDSTREMLEEIDKHFEVLATIPQNAPPETAAINILGRIEEQFGQALDDDEEVDGGDAVDFILRLLDEDIRPLLETVKTSPAPWFIVTGRIPFDDDDTMLAYQSATEEDAHRMFSDEMWEEAQANPEKRASERLDCKTRNGSDVFISSTAKTLAQPTIL